MGLNFSSISLKKIFGSSSVLILLSMISTIAVVFYEGQKVVDFEQQARASQLASDEVLRSKYYIVQIQQFLTDASLTGIDDVIEEADNNLALLKISMNRVAKAYPKLQAKTEELILQSEQVSKVGKEMFKAYSESGKEAGDAIMTRKGDGLDDRSAATSKNLEDLTQQIIVIGEESRNNFNHTLQNMRMMPIYFLIFAFFITVCGLFIIFRRINHISINSSALLSDVSDVGVVVGQLFSVAQNLAEGAVSQSASIEKTAAAIEEISAMAKQTADGASESESSSSRSEGSAEKGRQVVTQMVQSMREINNNNEHTNTIVTEGNEKLTAIVKVIQEIGEKTKVINDIVFQTKLLSFNASVEAARAGDYGNGFAVVAEEVGNLARMSGVAAMEISKMLDDGLKKVDNIVKETKSNVSDTMAKSLVSINSGMEIGKNCEEVLAEIVALSSEVKQTVARIAMASAEQSKGVTEVSGALHTIDKVTQVGLQSSKRCAEVAEQLAQKTNNLNNTSGQLRLLVEGKIFTAKFQWSEQYSLGIPEMDGEHKILVNKINLFAGILEQPEKRNYLSSLVIALDDLVACTLKHFSDEEAFMQSFSFPEFEEHIKIHRKLASQLEIVKNDLESKKINGPQVINFLNDWLMRHVLGMDQKYAQYISKQQTTEKQEAA